MTKREAALLLELELRTTELIAAWSDPKGGVVIHDYAGLTPRVYETLQALRAERQRTSEPAKPTKWGATMLEKGG